jgi:protocatechuate 3,4-dioxygenase beta subunit
MDGRQAMVGESRIAAELRARLQPSGPDRLGLAVGLILDHAFAILEELKPSEAEFEQLLQFLTDVGYVTDARRQEWVLLADVFGLSDHVAGCHARRDPAATPSTLAGPFYRPDAPRLENGANICRNGVGEPLAVTGRVTSTTGQPICSAVVDVWHANGQGRYENQDPDNQPEHNLRGRFVTDATGRFSFSTVRPAGYALPDDGPVGRLARRLGLSLDRPAHLHFAVTAAGYRPLVTAIFDGSDRAINRDALSAVKPALIGTFRPDGAGHSLDVTLALAPDVAPQANLHQKG